MNVRAVRLLSTRQRPECDTLPIMALPRSPSGATLVPAELLGPVVDAYRPKRVILFGSRARGDARPDSDIDLLVLVDDDAPAERLARENRRAARRRYKRPVTLIACRERSFAARRGVPGSIAADIARDGIVVYERQGA
jgi:uncharacterized protein